MRQDAASPDTRSTRSRSRTPSKVTAATLFRSVTSSGRAGTRISTGMDPARFTGMDTVWGTPATAGTRSTQSRSTRISTSAGAPWTAPDSSRTKTRSAFSRTIPKVGARRSRTRRSRSSGCPDRSTCTGPGKVCNTPSSSTRPSVRSRAPDTRSAATSCAAVCSAPRTGEASGPPVRTTRSSTPESRIRCSSTSAAASVSALRSASLWLPLSSITRNATSGSASRSSTSARGLASATSNTMTATVRPAVPRTPQRTPKTRSTTARQARNAIPASGIAGANARSVNACSNLRP